MLKNYGIVLILVASCSFRYVFIVLTMRLSEQHNWVTKRKRTKVTRRTKEESDHMTFLTTYNDGGLNEETPHENTPSPVIRGNTPSPVIRGNTL